MYELSISTTTDKQCYIDELCEKLKDEVKCDFGVIAKQNMSGRSYLAIAVPETKKEFYKAKIFDFIVFMIIDDYKFNFFKENLLIPEQNVISQSFLKAISIFDFEMDSEFIKCQIDLKREILVDSLFYFKLRPLKERWQKTAYIINQNQILCSTDSMIEVLKYLTMSSENSLHLAEIVVEKKQIKIKKQSKILCYKKNFEGYSNFLTEIVKLNPLKIRLKSRGDAFEETIVDFLSRIFADKVYLEK